jgi:hypothetical protein
MQMSKSTNTLKQQDTEAVLRLYGIPDSIAQNATVQFKHEGKTVESGLGEFLTALQRIIVSP